MGSWVMTMRFFRPAINYNFLANLRDQRRLVEGVKLSQRIARDNAMASVLAADRTPGDDIRDDTTLLRGPWH
jgi:choline dehydrogenase